MPVSAADAPSLDIESIGIQIMRGMPAKALFSERHFHSNLTLKSKERRRLLPPTALIFVYLLKHFA